MESIAIVTVLALMQAFMFAFQVGQARVKHDVRAPSVSGHPEFDRTFRIHQNTVEQLVIFIPSLWLFGYYVHPLIGAGIGVLFIISRAIYRKTYLDEPKGRTAGFGIGAVCISVLMLGGLGGAIWSLVQG